MMPEGPRAEMWSADAICAVPIAKIAMGEIEDERDQASGAAAQLGNLGGKKRAENMTPHWRSETEKNCG